MQSDLESEKGTAVDWQAYYHAIRDRIWVVLAATALGTVIAIVCLLRSETLYEADSVLFFADQQARVLKNVDVSDDQVKGLDMINTVVDVLQSNQFALRVVERLHLDSNPDFLRSIRSTETKITPDAAAGKLLDMTKAEYRKDTRLIDVKVSSRSASMAKLLANSMALEYLQYVLDKRMGETHKASEFLRAEAERLSKNLRESEIGLQRFRERERTASLEALQSETQTQLNVASNRITTLEQSLQQLQTDIVAAKVDPTATEELLRLPSVANQPKIASLTSLISIRERDFGVLAQRYRAKHPSYIAARTALDLTIADRTRALKEVIPLLEANEKQTKAQLDDAKLARMEAEKRMVEVTGKAIEYNELTRQVQTNQTLYNSVLGRLREVDVAKNMSDLPMDVNQLATSAIAVPPSVLKFLLIGILGGAFVGVATVAGIHAMDQSVKTVDEAEALTGVDVIATVPLVTDQKEHVDLAVATHRTGMVAESFRTLRTSLTVSGAASEERRVFIFTSAVPGEGKTFCSSNFAITLAQQEFRTLLIDADLREPKISTLFFKEKKTPGLADVLAKKTSLKDALTPSHIPDLTILPAGERAINAAELLGSPLFGRVIEEALIEFDRVVIDSAPCIAVSDTRLLLPYADACCFVIRAFSTPKSAVKRAIKMITDADAQPTGIVLNYLPYGRGAHYAYYYSGAYGGRDVYGAAQKKS